MAKIATTDQKRESSVRQGPAPSEKDRQEVERLAYHFFLERGCQHGFDRDDWIRAEAAVRTRRNNR